MISEGQQRGEIEAKELPGTAPAGCPAIYVINLAKSVERFSQVSTSLKQAGLGFERVEAIDAGLISREDLLGKYDAKKNRRGYFAPLSDSEMACFLSHRRAWRHFLDSGTKASALFLEDDAELVGPAEVVRSLLRCLALEPAPLLIKFYRLRPGIFAPSAGFSRHRITFPLVPPLGAVAQAMNRPAAAALLHATESQFEPVDVAIQRWWDMGIRVAQVTPNLFVESSAKVGGSTLRSRTSHLLTSKCKREIVRPVFQAGRLVRSLWETGRHAAAGFFNGS